MRAANMLPSILCMGLVHELDPKFGIISELDDESFDGLGFALHYALRRAARDGLYSGLSVRFSIECHERLKAKLGGQT